MSAECDDGVMCCSAIDDAEGHTRLLLWGLRRPPARATCPAPCQGERYDAVSASTALRHTDTLPHHTSPHSNHSVFFALADRTLLNKYHERQMTHREAIFLQDSSAAVKYTKT